MAPPGREYNLFYEKCLQVLTSLWACVAWYAAVSGRMLPRLLLGIVVVSELATVDCSLSITDC